MIKNIIFDFGDVFLNLDKEATQRMLIRQGFAGITPEIMEMFYAYETGLISTEMFIENARKWVPGASSSDLVKAWNAILLDFPVYRLEFLEQLARQGSFRLFLLSNTNSLHIDCVAQKMGEKQYQRFIDCFEQYYFSHEVHLRKPDKEIFLHIVKENQLDPAQTLFIDDTEEHTVSANSLGIHVWHLQVGKEDIIELMSRIPS